jgi:hypothetical protein
MVDGQLRDRDEAAYMCVVMADMQDINLDSDSDNGIDIYLQCDAASTIILRGLDCDSRLYLRTAL